MGFWGVASIPNRSLATRASHESFQSRLCTYLWREQIKDTRRDSLLHLLQHTVYYRTCGSIERGSANRGCGKRPEHAAHRCKSRDQAPPLKLSSVSLVIFGGFDSQKNCHTVTVRCIHFRRVDVSLKARAIFRHQRKSEGKVGQQLKWTKEHETRLP